MKWIKTPASWVFLTALCLAWWAGEFVPEVWVIEGRNNEGDPMPNEVTSQSHRGVWSLLPAFVTILLCFLTRRPAVSLMAGVLIGMLVLGMDGVKSMMPSPQHTTGGAAVVLMFYLICLGGLMGVWSRNGAAAAFAKWVTRRFVRGPRTAKLAAWALGVVFFQGGAPTTLLVGTAVKPIADEENVSHEELAYIVDSTASPVAILLPFNAWPFYVQGLIFVSGVGVLATETARVGFFFSAIPLSFYAMLAVGFTFLLSIDKLPFMLSVASQAFVCLRRHHEAHAETLNASLDWLDQAAEEHGMQELSALLKSLLAAPNPDEGTGKNSDAGPSTGPA